MGRRPRIQQRVVKEILALTTREKPEAATHWSTRTMAETVGVSHCAVHRIWKAHQLPPHRAKGFKVSNDPRFAEKVVDIVGPYVDPPRACPRP